MAETEKDRPVRRYAAAEITWYAPREQGFAHYAPVQSAPGERGQCPLVASIDGPHVAARRNGHAMIRKAAPAHRASR